VRFCDFPRLQIAGVGLALRVLAVLLRRPERGVDRVLAWLVTAATAVQTWLMFPYTRMARVQVRDAMHPTPENTLRLFEANVLMQNRDSAALLALIQAQDPDVILLTEANDWWAEQCRPLERTHRHTVLQPQGNTYGVVLYSRLELVAPEVLFRFEPAIPSIRTGVRLRGGEVIEFHAVHPRPPGENPPGPVEIQDAGPRDAELLLVARELKAHAGADGRAWSHTSRLMQRIGGLLDPRIGRGLFNTFHAGHPLLRYPLDHVFHTAHFTVAELRRLPSIGSDHFPMFVTLCFEPQTPQPRGVPTPKLSDEHEATESIEQER
jgi:endonuclease/exonuclease/phosphatase (EEP) superfamily protein YafD